MRNELGNRLRKARIEKGFSQFQLGKMIGVSQSAIAHIESGLNIPSIQNLILISNVLGVSPGTLLDKLDNIKF